MLQGLRPKREACSDRRWVNHFEPLIAADLRKRRPKLPLKWLLAGRKGYELVEPPLGCCDYPFRHFFPAVTARRLLRQRQLCAVTLSVIESEPRYQLRGDLLHGSGPDFKREERP